MDRASGVMPFHFQFLFVGFLARIPTSRPKNGYRFPDGWLRVQIPPASPRIKGSEKHYLFYIHKKLIKNLDK